VLLILSVAVAYLALFDRAIDPILDGGLLLGIVLGLYTGGALAYRRRLSQIQQRRRERLALAQQELSAQLQERIHQGLIRTYDHLAQMLRQMARALEDTTETLAHWSTADGLPTATPVSYADTHLRRSHLSSHIWDLCRAHLQAKQDSKGRHSEERLRASWRSVGWRRKLEGLLLEKHEDKPLAAALQELLRQSVQETIADLSAASTQSVRDELVKSLVVECNLEHLLWRHAVAARHPLLVQIDGGSKRASAQNLIHRYLESLASNAKPAANYDVADRLAAHGIPIDFAAVWGSPESDLTETTLREFRSTLLPTDDPFRINFVRTVHGLTLSDLGNIRRYYLELTLLSEAALSQVTLVGRRRHVIYGVGEQKSKATEAEHVLY
jgi:hypothetical protein